MGNLRIKLKYKSFEIEIEGEETTVQAEFKDIKQNGLGHVVNGIDMNEANYIIETSPRQLGATEDLSIESPEVITNSQNMPSIKEVIMKQLPVSEREWIIVYSFYSSNEGNKSFTPKSILEYYENTKRKTSSRHANMSKNIKSLFKKGYFSALNNEEYLLTESGKKYALEIIMRKNSAPTKQNKPTSKKTKDNDTSPAGNKVAAKKFEVLKDINFRPTGKDSLIDYANGYKINSNADRIVVIIKYLNEILQIQPITGNHIYSGFWELKCKIPNSFYQIITNAKNREKFLDYTSISDIKLSIQGENYVRFDMQIK